MWHPEHFNDAFRIELCLRRCHLPQHGVEKGSAAVGVLKPAIYVVLKRSSSGVAAEPLTETCLSQIISNRTPPGVPAAAAAPASPSLAAAKRRRGLLGANFSTYRS